MLSHRGHPSRSCVARQRESRSASHPARPFEEPKAPTPAPLKSGREIAKDNEARPEKTERASEALAFFLAFLEFNH